MILFPTDPTTPLKSVVHFTGGFALGAAPAILYSDLLEFMSSRGFVIIATPIPLIPSNHTAIAAACQSAFRAAHASLGLEGLPVLGMGHSLGGKLTALMSCSDSDTEPPRARLANVFMCFNNFGKNQRSAAAAPLGAAPAASADEFTPSPQQTWARVAAQYRVPRSLLLRFGEDGLDQSPTLAAAIAEAAATATAGGGGAGSGERNKQQQVPQSQLVLLPGLSHLSPAQPDAVTGAAAAAVAAGAAGAAGAADSTSALRRSSSKSIGGGWYGLLGRKLDELVAVDAAALDAGTGAGTVTGTGTGAGTGADTGEGEGEGGAGRVWGEGGELQRRREAVRAAAERAFAAASASGRAAALAAAAPSSSDTALAAEGETGLRARVGGFSGAWGSRSRSGRGRGRRGTALSMSATTSSSEQTAAAAATAAASSSSGAWDWESRFFSTITGFGADHTTTLSASGRRVLSSMGPAETYGEITSAGIRSVLRLAGPLLGEEDHMVDLGSGVGKVVAQFAHETRCGRCLGVELGERRHRGAVAAREAMLAGGRGPASRTGTGTGAAPGTGTEAEAEADAASKAAALRMHFLNSDVLAAPAVEQWAPQSSVIFVNAVCFPPALWAAIEHVILTACPRLRFLIIAGPTVAKSDADASRAFHDKFEERAVSSPGAASWTEGEFSLTLYSRR